MSIRKVFICDVCGKQIDNHDGHYKAYFSSVCEDGRSIDICRSCFEEIKAFVKEKGGTNED